MSQNISNKGNLGIQRRSRFYRRFFPLFSIAISRGKYHRLTFSQFGEDVILLNLFGGNLGHYLDIGSGHPIRGSNTFSLYRMGWSGILIDPVSNNIDLASKQRPRDRCLRAICSSAGGELDFWEYLPSELSTTSPNRVQELKTSGHTPIDRYSVQSITIKDLQILTTPMDPFVLSIDVEGAEFDVLNGCDWESFLPAIVVLEQHSPPWLENTPSGRLLISKGYELSDYVGLSSVYIHNQSPFRIQRDKSVQQ